MENYIVSIEILGTAVNFGMAPLRVAPQVPKFYKDLLKDI